MLVSCPKSNQWKSHPEVSPKFHTGIVKIISGRFDQSTRLNIERKVLTIQGGILTKSRIGIILICITKVPDAIARLNLIPLS